MTTTPRIGLGLAVLSAASFGTSGAFAASLIATGWTPAAAVTTRVTVAALLLTVPAALSMRGRWRLLRRNVGTVLAAGLFGVAGAQLAYFSAVQHLSVGVALLLEYQGVVLVVLWLWLRHGRRPRRLTLAGAAVAVAGLVLVLDLLGGVRLAPVGVLWGFAAAVGLAAYFVVVSDDRDPVPPLALSCAALWVGAGALLAAAVTGLLELRATAEPVLLAGQRVSWLVPVTGLSVIAAVVAYVAGVAGARLLGATLASFVGLTEVLFAVLFAWLLLGQLPAPLQILGGAVVLAGVALVRADELRTATAGPGPARTAPEPLPADVR